MASQHIFSAAIWFVVVVVLLLYIQSGHLPGPPERDFSQDVDSLSTSSQLSAGSPVGRKSYQRISNAVFGHISFMPPSTMVEDGSFISGVLPYKAAYPKC